MYRINEYLTPSERVAAMRIGGVKAMASMGVTPAEFEKRAQAAGDGLLTSAIKLSLYLGIPLGVAHYAVSSAFDMGESNRRRKKALDTVNDIIADYGLERGTPT